MVWSLTAGDHQHRPQANLKPFAGERVKLNVEGETFLRVRGFLPEIRAFKKIKKGVHYYRRWAKRNTHAWTVLNNLLVN